MSFRVDKFVTEIKTRGILPENLVEVSFPLPNGLRLNNTLGMAEMTETARDISLYGETSCLPGVSLAVDEIRRYGTGVIEKKPLVPVFTDLPIIFRLDARGRIRNLLTNWVRLIMPISFEVGMRAQVGSLPTQLPFEIAYKADYTVDLTVRAFNAAGEIAEEVVFREAYPQTITDVPLAWGSRGDYARLKTSFCFFDWYQSNRQFPAASVNVNGAA